MMQNHIRFLIPRAAVLLPAGLLLVLSVTGCGKLTQGPKSADYQTAHTPRYHPDLQRQTDTTQPADPLTTAPAVDQAVTQPAGGDGPMGCPVVFVNGQPLTVQDILEPIMAELARQAKTSSLARYADLLREQATQQIQFQINTLLIYHEAKKAFGDKKIEFLDKEIEKIITSRVNAEFEGVRTRFLTHLKALDLTEDDVKERIRRQILVAQFQRDRFSPLLSEPARRNLMNYYNAHMDDFTAPAKAHLLLIEIPFSAELKKPVAQATADEIAQARELSTGQLRRAREELASGVEFAAVAKKYSKGLKAAQGGDWGEISPGALTGRWAKPAEVLFTLRADQVSEVIETEESAFVVKCQTYTPATTLSFEQAQPKIIERIKNEQFNRLSIDYIQELRDRATVQKLPEFFQAVVSAAPRPASTNPLSDAKSPGNEPQ